MVLGTPPATREIGSPAARLRAARRLLLIGGSVYLAWWAIVELVVPGSYNPIASRLAVVGCFVVVYAASFLEAMQRRVEAGLTACHWILTLHYYVLVSRNHGETPWAVGALVVAVAVAACIHTPAALVAYSAFTLIVAAAISITEPALLRSIFLPGLLTMLLLANVGLRTRHALEIARAERVRADVARDAAEEGVRVRDEFLRVASHELNTPLTALLLSLTLLDRTVRRAGGDEISATAFVRMVERCSKQGGRLARLVASMLEGSTIAANPIALAVEDVALLDVARTVARTLGAEADKAGGAIEVTGDASVVGRWDRARVAQVVENLLRNALSFGKGTAIVVAVTSEGSRARLSVADQGIGIDAAHHAMIFDRFWRAVSSRNYGGLGLGLFLVRKIVEAHGGTVRVESALGHGATFIVELPRTV